MKAMAKISIRGSNFEGQSKTSSTKKGGKAVKTFYTLMQNGGYISEAGDGLKKKVQREWHVRNLKSELDSDYSDDDF
jgi:hypothetical protein